MASIGFASAALALLLLAPWQTEAEPPRVIMMRPALSPVPAGPVTISVTFDRPMRANSYSFVMVDGAAYPDCGDAAPVRSANGRTFTIKCRVEAGRRYAVGFNTGRFRNFVSATAGPPALAATLRFSTR